MSFLIPRYSNILSLWLWVRPHPSWFQAPLPLNPARETMLNVGEAKIACLVVRGQTKHNKPFFVHNRSSEEGRNMDRWMHGWMEKLQLQQCVVHYLHSLLYVLLTHENICEGIWFLARQNVLQNLHWNMTYPFHTTSNTNRTHPTIGFLDHTWLDVCCSITLSNQGKFLWSCGLPKILFPTMHLSTSLSMVSFSLSLCSMGFPFCIHLLFCYCLCFFSPMLLILSHLCFIFCIFFLKNPFGPLPVWYCHYFGSFLCMSKYASGASLFSGFGSKPQSPLIHLFLFQSRVVFASRPAVHQLICSGKGKNVLGKCVQACVNPSSYLCVDM